MTDPLIVIPATTAVFAAVAVARLIARRGKRH